MTSDDAVSSSTMTSVPLRCALTSSSSAGTGLKLAHKPAHGSRRHERGDLLGQGGVNHCTEGVTLPCNTQSSFNVARYMVHSKVAASRDQHQPMRLDGARNVDWFPVTGVQIRQKRVGQFVGHVAARPESIAFGLIKSRSVVNHNMRRHQISLLVLPLDRETEVDPSRSHHARHSG